MGEKKRVTIKDISKRLGISPTTVANALNGHSNVSDELRKRIVDAADEMGYRPNLNAKAMVKNGISIALILSEEPREHLKYVRKGIYEQIEKLSDYKVSLADFAYHDNRSNAEVKDCVLRMTKKRYDGIIFSPSFETESYVEILSEYVVKNNIPLVLLNNGGFENRVCSVTVDEEIIGKMVAQFISLTHGKTKIGVITTSEHFSIHHRIVEVLKNECAAYGIEIAAILENNDIKADTYACTDRIMTEHPDITAIYITSYDSVQVCRCLKNKDITGVAVIAHDVHDDMLELMRSGAQTAAVFQNPRRIGAVAVEKIFGAIMGTEQDKRVLIRPELVLRSNLDAYAREL